MKKTLLITVAGVWAMMAQAQLATNNYTMSPAVAVPDGNPVGVTEATGVSGLTGTISDIQVSLDITGGFNGDLYAYLVSPSQQIAILLNRTGLTGVNPAGGSDAGFDITLESSGGVNIHGYGSSYSTNSVGQVIGTWAPDGRNIDPQSAGSAFDSAATMAGFGSLLGGNPNGDWTLFIADLSAGGGTSVVQNWGLTIVTSAPEPESWALALSACLLFIGIKRQFSQRWP